MLLSHPPPCNPTVHSIAKISAVRAVLCTMYEKPCKTGLHLALISVPATSMVQSSPLFLHPSSSTITDTLPGKYLHFKSPSILSPARDLIANTPQHSALLTPRGGRGGVLPTCRPPASMRSARRSMECERGQALPITSPHRCGPRGASSSAERQEAPICAPDSLSSAPALSPAPAICAAAYHPHHAARTTLPRVRKGALSATSQNTT